MSWEKAADQAKIIAPAVADIAKAYFDAFLAKGFTPDQATTLTATIMGKFYTPNTED